MRFDSVINKFMFEANFTKRLRINGDGDQWRSFIHIDRLTTILKNIAMTDLKPDIYNLVTNSLKINTIVDELRSLYPGLEMIFVNQNMKMRSLRVKPDERIPEVRSLDIKSLAVQMSEFKDQFSF